MRENVEIHSKKKKTVLNNEKVKSFNSDEEHWRRCQYCRVFEKIFPKCKISIGYFTEDIFGRDF